MSVVQLDSTYGAVFIGMVVASILYGISCVQAFYYYTVQNDPWYFKHTVTTVMILDTIHQAMISHAVYTYTITYWGDLAQLQSVVWSLVIEVLFVGITALIVQCVLAHRIWKLGRNIYLTAIPLLLAVGSFVSLTINTVLAMEAKSPADFATSESYTIAATVLAAAADIMIAATLCIYLNASRTGIQRSEIIINRLIMLTVNTGLLTSLCAVGALISIVAATGTLVHGAFYFCLGRLYINTLLATFNARESIRDVSAKGASSNGSYNLRDIQKKLSSNQAQNLSITIDTSTETYNSQRLEDKEGLHFDEGSTQKLSC